MAEQRYGTYTNNEGKTRVVADREQHNEAIWAGYRPSSAKSSAPSSTSSSGKSAKS